MTWVLWLAMALGLASSLAALWGRYRDLPEWMAGAGFCSKDGACETLLRSRRAALLGIPNAVLAAAFSPLLAWGLRSSWDPRLLLGAASLALAMTLFLAWSLVSRKLRCRICWAGHLANATIWVVLLARLV